MKHLIWRLWTWLAQRAQPVTLPKELEHHPAPPPARTPQARRPSETKRPSTPSPGPAPQATRPAELRQPLSPTTGPVPQATRPAELEHPPPRPPEPRPQTTSPAEFEQPSRLPASSASPPVSAPRHVERTLIVGVDFGTSSTKVIWQDLSDNHFEMFRWTPATQGLTAFLLPSTVVIRGGFLHFGLSQGDACEGDIQMSSIKLCLLCRTNHSICRCGSPVSRYGVVRLPNSEMPHPASAFACLFLAHVFQEVETKLVGQFPNDDLLLLWNIGCPMDYMDEAKRKDEWEKLVGVAMELHRRVSGPASTSLLAKVTERLSSFIVPAPGNRNYFVQPEGLAAVKAFLESPHAESRTYAIVDVGAGTTEVSFFFNGRIMTEPGQPLRPSYLADTTAAVGGGKIDLELAQVWKCSVENARQRKEAGDSNLPMVPSIGEISVQYERTCCEILRRHRLTAANDKRFDLFVIGGGGRLRPLREALRGRPLPGGFVREGWRQLQPPKSLTDRQSIQADYDFLANACGLASSLCWEYYPSPVVGPMPPPPPPKPKPDLDEYYPK